MHFKSGVKKKEANRKFQGEVAFAWFRVTRPVPLAKLFAQICAQTNIMIFDVIPLNKYCLSINYDQKSSMSCLFSSNYCESLPIFAESELLIEKITPGKLTIILFLHLPALKRGTQICALRHKNMSISWSNKHRTWYSKCRPPYLDKSEIPVNFNWVLWLHIELKKKKTILTVKYWIWSIHFSFLSCT